MPVIGHRKCLEDAFKLLQDKRAPAIGVTDATGKLVGLVTSETISEMMMLQDALPGTGRPGPWGRPAGVITARKWPDLGRPKLNQTAI